jgi:ClpP class serine protease
MNETIQGLMINGSIPLTVTVNTATNWAQFFMTMAITLIASFGFLLILYFPQIISAFSVGGLGKISKLTKRNVVMIKHTEAALFSQSMIDQQCLRDMSQVMNKMEGKDFDLILHTPGGDVFSSLAISRIIKQYPGRIRAIIPLYSMSGGSLLALSCKELLMSPNACIGPIDPQLGSLFKFGSAAAWEKIVKFKGKKAEDQSISFAMMGKQYTKSIAAHLNKIIGFDLATTQKNKLIQFLTDGSIEHAYPLTITDLKGFGLPINTIDNIKFLKYLSKLVSSRGKEGVTYHKISRWRL